MCRWTDAEIRLLKREFAANTPMREIQWMLGRSIAAIRIKATRLRLAGEDVAWRKSGWPRGKKRGPRRRALA